MYWQLVRPVETSLHRLRRRELKRHHHYFGYTCLPRNIDFDPCLGHAGTSSETAESYIMITPWQYSVATVLPVSELFSSDIKGARRQRIHPDSLLFVLLYVGTRRYEIFQNFKKGMMQVCTLLRIFSQFFIPIVDHGRRGPSHSEAGYGLHSVTHYCLGCM